MNQFVLNMDLFFAMFKMRLFTGNWQYISNVLNRCAELN